MGNLEKYGVCALLFVIVTVLAISIWGPRPARPSSPSPPSGAPAGSREARASSPERSPQTPAGPARGARLLEGTSADATKSGLLSQFKTHTDQLFGLQPVPIPGATPASENPPEPAKPEASAPAASPPPPSGARAPSAPQPRIYVVKKGDVLEAIAQRELGSSAKWREIVQWNEGIDPRRIREGQEIVIPPSDFSLPLVALGSASPAPRERPEAAAAPSAGSAHTVAKGETLYTIAERYLRNGSRWREIYEANRGNIEDPDRLRVGTVIQIPER
jgi:nucleoid-associated protein YgaU